MDMEMVREEKKIMIEMKCSGGFGGSEGDEFGGETSNNGENGAGSPGFGPKSGSGNTQTTGSSGGLIYLSL